MNLELPTAQKQNFAVEFTKAVHGGLGRVIGKNEAESVLINMRLQDGLLDPVEFHGKLVALLGGQATLCLEKEIVLDLVDRLDLPLDVLEPKREKEGFDFNAVVRAAEKAANI